MSSRDLLRSSIMPYLNTYRGRISASGIRYGSVLYVAFGKGISKAHVGRASTTRYPVELEIGSDTWVLTKDNDMILDSQFDNIQEARSEIHNILVGRKMLDIETTQTEGIVTFDANLVLRSCIVPEPGSGFLYSFQVQNGPEWETLDGAELR